MRDVVVDLRIESKESPRPRVSTRSRLLRMRREAAGCALANEPLPLGRGFTPGGAGSKGSRLFFMRLRLMDCCSCTLSVPAFKS